MTQKEIDIINDSLMLLSEANELLDANLSTIEQWRQKYMDLLKALKKYKEEKK